MNLGTYIPTALQTRASLEIQPTDAFKRIPELWLVDDNREIRRLLADLLQRDGTMQCTRQFSSAESLLAALEKESAPDAILLDVQMRGMSGVDASFLGAVGLDHRKRRLRIPHRLLRKRLQSVRRRRIVHDRCVLVDGF